MPPAVRASVFALSHEDQLDHAPLVREFVNATHWPKHLLVHYRWRTQHEEDEEGGLLVLFAGARLGPARLRLPRTVPRGAAWSECSGSFLQTRCTAGQAGPCLLWRCTLVPGPPVCGAIHHHPTCPT